MLPAGGRRGPRRSRACSGRPSPRTPCSSRSAPPMPRSARCSRSRRSGASRARRACRSTWTASARSGRVPLNVEAMGIDLLTVSGNDLYGPPGSGRPLGPARACGSHPQVLGGGQEGGYRSGTENLPGVVGLGVAAELMRVEGAHQEAARLAALRDRLMHGLLEAIPDCRLTGLARASRLPAPPEPRAARREGRQRPARPRSGRRRRLVGLGLRLADPDDRRTCCGPSGARPRKRKARSASRSAAGAPPPTWTRCWSGCRPSWRACARSPPRSTPSPLARSVKLVLFDIDGTLITSRGAGRRAMRTALERGLRRRRAASTSTTCAAGPTPASSTT